MVEVHKTNWDQKLFSALWAYRNTEKITTQKTPHYMMYGFNPLMPVEFEIPTERTLNRERLTATESETYRLSSFEKLEEERMLALKNNEEMQWKRKTRFDKRLKKHNIKKDDLVLVKDSRHSKFVGKLQTCWGGPYKVVKIWKNGSLQLEYMDGELFETRVNGSRVKKYYVNEIGWLDVCGTLIR